MLQPWYKLQYFWKADWPDDWVDAAKQLVLEEFRRSYTDVADTEGSLAEKANQKEKPVMDKKVSMVPLLC